MKLDEIYDAFEKIMDEMEEGVTGTSDIKKLEALIPEIDACGKGDPVKKDILRAYIYSHIGYGYYTLADFEEEFGTEDDSLQHYADAKKAFDTSVEKFSSIAPSDDRDYLFADCYQMYADFLETIFCHSDRYGLKDVNEGDIEKFYKLSVNMYEQLLNGNDYDTREELVDVCYNFAGYYYSKHDKDKSRPLFERAKSLAEELEKEEPGTYEEFLDQVDQYME
jgi:hypothetical protein